MTEELKTEVKPKKLSFDDKLDKIMEAVVFQQQLLLATLKAVDNLLANKSNIIKPVGIS